MLSMIQTWNQRYIKVTHKHSRKLVCLPKIETFRMGKSKVDYKGGKIRSQKSFKPSPTKGNELSEPNYLAFDEENQTTPSQENPTSLVLGVNMRHWPNILTREVPIHFWP